MKSKMILLGFLLTIPAFTQPTQKEMKKVDPLSAALMPTILNAPDRGRDASVYKVQRDFTLEQQVSVRAKKIESQLQSRTKKKLDDISIKLLNQLISSPRNIDIYSLARKQIHKEFSKISDKQTKVLMVYTLSGLTEEMKRKLESMNEMSEMTALRLQMTMDRRSKFISTLSQLMKKISDTQDILVQNIK